MEIVEQELQKVLSPEAVEVLVRVFVPIIEDAIDSLETWHGSDAGLPKIGRCACSDCTETRAWLQALLRKVVLWHLYLNDAEAGVTLQEVVESLLPVHGTAAINTRWPLLIRNEKLKRQRRKGQMTLDLETTRSVALANDSSLEPSLRDGLEVVSECLN